MPDKQNEGGGKSDRGFASMDEQKRRAISRKGGESVPAAKRSFSQDPHLAAQAGRKGGQSVPPEKRSFSQDKGLASQAGKKGGQARSLNQASAKENAARESVRKASEKAHDETHEARAEHAGEDRPVTRRNQQADAGADPRPRRDDDDHKD